MPTPQTTLISVQIGFVRVGNVDPRENTSPDPPGIVTTLEESKPRPVHSRIGLTGRLMEYSLAFTLEARDLSDLAIKNSKNPRIYLSE